MDELAIIPKVICSHAKIVNCYKPAEEGGMWYGGYSLRYDMNGKLIERTDPVYFFRVYIDPPEKTFLQKTKEWLTQKMK